MAARDAEPEAEIEFDNLSYVEEAQAAAAIAAGQNSSPRLQLAPGVDYLANAHWAPEGASSHSTLRILNDKFRCQLR